MLNHADLSSVHLPATPRIRAQKHIVLAAVEQNHGALEYASQSLREDEEFVVAAYVKSYVGPVFD